MENIISEALITSVNSFFKNDLSVSLYVKRDDLIHPQLGGNKWFKLKYNLLEMKRLGSEKLLTFGGAYSNHIYSTAAAGKIFNIKTIGIIRGEEYSPLNPTLSFAKKMGMELHYVSREEYRKKDDPFFIKNLREKFGNIFIVPEGGSNMLGVKGASEILTNLKENYDYIALPCGTGTTMAGIISSDHIRNAKVIGFSVLKGGSFLVNNISDILQKSSGKNYNNWEVITDYHFDGYAKTTGELFSFMKSFEENTGIILDPVYTAKMFFGIIDMIEKNFFPKNSKILAVHTGGLQGRKGMGKKL